MTDRNSLPNRDPHPVSPLGRVGEWFWRGAALEEQRQSASAASEGARAFGQRARASADLANLAWSSQSFELTGQAIACELYRQSIYWSLCALSGMARVDAGGMHDSESIWSTLDPKLLAESSDDAETREALQVSIRTGSFIHFAELSPADQDARCKELRQLAARLSTRLDKQQRAVDAIRFQRVWRVGLVILMVMSVALALPIQRRNWQERHDLAAGSAWRASSSYGGGGGCRTPEQQCPESTGWFFHTREDDANPWIEFALGEGRTISAVLADNREDCCAERAVPLAVEVSQDHRHWTRVAERSEVFTQWRASFSTTPARWVRLRLLRRGPLHLARVRIFP